MPPTVKSEICSSTSLAFSYSISNTVPGVTSGGHIFCLGFQMETTRSVARIFPWNYTNQNGMAINEESFLEFLYFFVKHTQRQTKLPHTFPRGIDSHLKYHIDLLLYVCLPTYISLYSRLEKR